MKKITIQHYLNKRLQPTIIYENIVAYPLYLQIIAQRKTQQIKSFFNVYMSEKAFEIMSNGGRREEYMYETNILNFYDYDFEEEPKVLKSAIEFLITNNIDYNLKSKYFRLFMEDYTQRAFKVFSKEAAKIEIGDLRLDDFTSCLNIGDKTLIYIKESIKSTTKTDIFKYLPANYIKIWQVVELIKYADEGKNFIKFIENNPLQKLLKLLEDERTIKLCGKTNKTLQKIELKEIFEMLSKRIIYSITNLFS